MAQHDGSISTVFPTQARLIPTNRKPSSTPESKYWTSFKTTKDPSSFIHPITAIDFSPTPPHHMALSSSASISIYSSLTFSPISTLSSSFSVITYSLSFRCDGLLLAAGSHSGTVHIFNPKTRFPLRLLRSHSRPAHLVSFPRLADKLHLFSAADDTLLNYWDVPSETPLLSFQSHKDYVCGISLLPDPMITPSASGMSVGPPRPNPSWNSAMENPSRMFCFFHLEA